MDFLIAGHAGADNHRLAGSCNCGDKAQVNNLEAGYFVYLTTDALQEVQRWNVEWRREWQQTARLRPVKYQLMPHPWHPRFQIEFSKIFAGPCSTLDGVALIHHHVIRVPGLQLNRICSSLSRRIDNRKSPLQSAVMVRPQLGHDERLAFYSLYVHWITLPPSLLKSRSEEHT